MGEQVLTREEIALDAMRVDPGPKLVSHALALGGTDLAARESAHTFGELCAVVGRVRCAAREVVDRLHASIISRESSANREEAGRFSNG